MAVVGASISIASVLSDYPVLAGQTWRYLLAGLILLGILASQSGSLARVSSSNAARLVLIAATGLAAFNWLLIEGNRHADPAFMASVVGATPVVLALCGPLASGTRIRPMTVVGSVFVVTGIVVVHGATDAPLSSLPYALGFLACEVAFTLLAVPVLRELSPLQLSTTVCLIAVPMLAGLSLVTSENIVQVPTGTEALALLYMAVLTTAVAFLLWYSGVARLGADRAGLFVGIMPIAGYLTGLVIGSSTWAVTALAGVLLCGLGIAIGLFPGRSRAVGSDDTNGPHTGVVSPDRLPST